MEPIARIRARAWCSSSRMAMVLTSPWRSNRSTSPGVKFGAEALCLVAHRSRQRGPAHGRADTGVVVHRPGDHQCTAGHLALARRGCPVRLARCKSPRCSRRGLTRR